MKNTFFRKTVLTLVFIIAIILSACSPRPGNPDLILATTTSTQDSGLLDALIPLFEADSGYIVKVVAVGTGEALKLGEQGNADVLLVHAPSSEELFMQNGFGSDRRLVMHNDFIIVGPGTDPAGILGLNPTQALSSIASTQLSFVSRGDDSGTHKKELALWNGAGIDPTGQPWYLETGQGMGATLTIASETGSYVLTDRATYLANQENLSLVILSEGDNSLLNIYHVIVVNPDLWSAVNNEGAIAFADFITSKSAQKLIGEFGVSEYGQPLFIPDADKTDAEFGLP
jgi:tungstate transport system substrate-binding protein